MSDIGGATGQTFYVTGEYEGKRLRLLERVLTADGTASAWAESDWIGPVEPANAVGFYTIGWAPTVDATEFETLDGATVDTTFLFPQLIVDQAGPAIARVDWLAIDPNGVVLWERLNDTDPPYNLRWNGLSFPEGVNTVTATVVYADPANASEVVTAVFTVAPPETEVPDPPDSTGFAGPGNVGAYATGGPALTQVTGGKTIAQAETWENRRLMDGLLVVPSGRTDVTLRRVHTVWPADMNSSSSTNLAEYCTFGPGYGYMTPELRLESDKDEYNIMLRQSLDGGGGFTYNRCEMTGCIDLFYSRNTGGTFNDCWFHRNRRQSSDPYFPGNNSHNDVIQTFGTGQHTFNRCRFSAFHYGSATGRTWEQSYPSSASDTVPYQGEKGTSWMMFNSTPTGWVFNDCIFEGNITAGFYFDSGVSGFQFRRCIFNVKGLRRAIFEGPQSAVSVFEDCRVGLNENDTQPLTKSQAYSTQWGN